MMSTIKPIDVSDACRAVKSKGYLETALKMKSLAGQVFRYAVQTAKAERDVTQDLKGTLKKPPTKHYPAIIDPVEFGQMLRSIDDYHEERLAKHCFAATQEKSYARSVTRIQKGLGYKTPRQIWFNFYRQAA